MPTTKNKATKKQRSKKAPETPNKSSKDGLSKKQKSKVSARRAKYLPKEWIKNYAPDMPDGGITRSVPTDFASFTIYYDPQNIRQTFHTIFSDILARTGREEPYIFRGPSTGLDMKIAEVTLIEELKAEPATTETDSLLADPAARSSATSPYAELAKEIFEQKIVYALASFSDQIMMQVIIATIHELNEKGYISISKGHELKAIWKQFHSSYEKATKAHWAPMKPGRKNVWTKVNLKRLAKAHSLNEKLAIKLKNIYESKDSVKWRDGEWVKQVRREYGDIYDWVLYQVPGSDYKDVALLLSSKQFKLYFVEEEGLEDKDGKPGIYARLLEARKVAGPETHEPEYSEDDENDSGFSIEVFADEDE
jgi:hypothetical protein